MRRRNHESTCWVVYFDRPPGPGADSPGLVPVAVVPTERDADRLLQRLLTATPGRNNMYEDYPYFPREHGRTAADDSGDVVHLVVAEEDGPVISEVFGSLAAATRHAEELREPGGYEVTVTDLTMEAGDHDE